MLFSGSLRFNLDPFDVHTDQSVWEALDNAHLGDFVKELPGQLNYITEEGGQNLRYAPLSTNQLSLRLDINIFWSNVNWFIFS